MSRNLTELSKRKGLANNLFETISDRAKGLSQDTIEDISDIYLIGKANVRGTESFYDLTRKENRNKKAFVCNGSACQLAGSQTAIHNKLQKHFDASDIGELCCLGRCYENGAFQLDGINYSGNDIKHIAELTQNKSNENDNNYIVRARGASILTSANYCDSVKPEQVEKVLSSLPADLFSEIQTSELKGRGGAAFPISLKLAACRHADGETKYIVCNADEGDPASYSDRYLLEVKPHAILLGMFIAGYITGADTGILYIRAEYPASIRIIREAINEWNDAGYLDDNRFPFSFKIIEAQGAYICGEETALLASIEGQRPEVRVRPPYPTEQGLYNQPTLVNNVETFANLPFILEFGGKTFQMVGTEDSTGTKLLSLDGFFNRPGVYEVDMGFPLSRLVYEMAGGFREPVKALHIGGPLGGLVPIEKIDELLIEFGHFRKEGFSLGHASILCIPEKFSLIKYLEHLFSFTAHESCGKCFPCRLGSKRGAEMLQKAGENGYQIPEELFKDLLNTLEEGSLCGLGSGLPLPVRNALTWFSGELSPHFSSKTT